MKKNHYYLHETFNHTWAVVSHVYSADDLKKMEQCQQQVDGLMAIYDVAPQFIPTIKKAMVLRGIEMKPVCAQPLLPATEEETEEIRRILKEGNLV